MVEVLQPVFQEQFTGQDERAQSLLSLVHSADGLSAESVALLAVSTSGHLDLFEYLFRDRQIHSLRDAEDQAVSLGLTSLYANTLSAIPHDILVIFRAQLLRKEPTALLYGMLASDGFPVSAEQRESCRTVIQRMRDAKLDISKDSVRRVFSDAQYMAGIPSQQQPQIAELLAKLQRLQAVVHDPDDIVRLLRTSFDSAASISRMNLDGFKAAVSSVGIDSSTATRIYQQSSLVQRRNEQIWVKTLTARNEVSVLATVAAKNDKDPVNFSNLFPDLIQSTQCCECSSITSPAAYLVDFLQSLTRWPRDKGPFDKSLRDHLFERRPDLGNLHLSCTNTFVAIPYIDLVNEALESVISHREAVVRGIYDEDESSDVGEVIEPQNVAYDVYRTIIQRQLFPLGIFPYNFAIDSIQSCVRALGFSRYEAIQKLQSPYRLAKSQPTTRDLQLAKEVLDRCATAELLGLQEEDYLAITGESFLTADFLGISNKDDYEKRIGLQPSCAYWGYSTNDDMVSVDEGRKGGLSFIREQFLKRSELSFQELLDLLRSSFMNGRVAIEMFDGSAKFSGKVDDMRLRQISNGSNGGKLDETLCHQLQAFIRLRRKLGWSIHDTSIALTTLSGTNNGSITPATLRELAAAKRIADEVEIPLTALLPLWSDIDVFEPGSLYASLFLSSKLRPANIVFHADRNGQYLVGPPAKLNTHIAVVLAALQMPATAYDAIQKATSMTDELTISNLSVLYRIATFCKIAGLHPEQYSSFLALGYENHFACPAQTRQVLSRYKRITDAGWTPEKLLLVIGKGASAGIPSSPFEVVDIVDVAGKFIALNVGIGGQSDDSLQNGDTSNPSAAMIAQIIRPFFSQLPDETLQYMLTNILTVSDSLPIAEAVKKISRPNILGQSFIGYFTPPVTGTYSFSALQQASMPKLSVAGTTVEFSLSDKTKAYESQQPRRFLSGQAYEFKWEGNLVTNLSWIVGDAQPVRFDDTILVDEPAATLTRSILVKLSQVAQLVDTCGLTVDDVHHFQQHVPGFDFNNISLRNIEELDTYSGLRPPTRSDSTSSPLLNFRKWLRSPSNANDLASQLAAVGNWTETHVQQVISAQFPSLSNLDIVSVMLEISSFARLHEAIKFTASLKGTHLTPELLHRLTEPTSRPEDSIDRQYDNAKDLQAASQSASRSDSPQAANNVLRENRRAALVAFLLQQDYIRGQYKLQDADALFEHFLIDVQMGSGFKTSRLKQAISVAQLYVQRCLLGLEEVYGVPRTVIKREEWELLMRYRLWEANRKAYLYPENWIDPTLRDDKTEQFATMETSIMRKKLTDDVIEQAVTQFIHSIDDVARLEVQAYLWECQDTDGYGLDRDQGNVHLFARTPTVPSNYYYRSVNIRGPKSDSVMFWKPWTKMDIGIIAQETDSNGQKLAKPGVYLIPVVFKSRLYLFIPHFTLKTMPGQSSGKTFSNFQALSNEPPYSSSAPQKQIWEMTMGWSECKNGQWSAKRVAHGAIQVAGGSSADAAWSLLNGNQQSQAGTFPSVGSFQFSTRTRSVRPIYGTQDVNILTIDVDRWVGSGSLGTRELNGFSSYPLGCFELRGQSLVLAEPDVSFAGKSTIPTDFMRLSWPAGSSEDLPKATCDRYGGTAKRPILAQADDYEKSLTYTWIMSMNFVNSPVPSGLVAEVKTGDDAHTFMIYPPAVTRYANFDTVNLQNEIAPILIEISAADRSLEALYDSLSNLPNTLYNTAFGGQHGVVFHEQADPYALHSWETGIHAISLLTERLQATGQQELALSIARLAFDPSWEDPKLGRVWRFPPFRDPDTRDSLASDPNPSWENKWAIMEWNTNSASIHAAARGHPVAYMKRIAIKYVEILIDAGDVLFRQNTIESVPLALQRYVEALHVFGPAPIQEPELAKRYTLTYNQLAAGKLDPMSNCIVDLELDFPFQSDPATRGISSSSNSAGLAYIETGYFCVPSNPQVMALRNLIDDRMFKIRNNLDIDGNVQDRPLFEPPIDPGQLVRNRAAGVSPSSFANNINGPMPRHRFMYLLQRTYQLIEELKNMESLILSIKEKKDAEALVQLTTSHRLAVQQINVESKTAEKKEATKTLDVLQETRSMHEQRLSFFLALTGDTQAIPGPDATWADIPQLIDKPTADDLRMASGEKLDMDSTESALAKMPIVSVLDSVATDLLVFPQANINAQPLGIGVSTEIGTGIIARALQAAAGVIRAQVQYDQDQGTLASKKSYLIRQLQERRQQANQAGRDIKTVDKQIIVQKLQIERLDIEIRAQSQESENIAQELEWYQSKYTNDQLYSWLENQYASVYRDTYTIASQMAQKVQKAYLFENPHDNAAYLSPVASRYWDGSRDGLLCGARLSLDLKKIEAAYLDCNPYDFEIEKTVSLRQLNPLALLSIRETGSADFSLPEVRDVDSLDWGLAMTHEPID